MNNVESYYTKEEEEILHKIETGLHKALKAQRKSSLHKQLCLNKYVEDAMNRTALAIRDELVEI